MDYFANYKNLSAKDNVLHFIRCNEKKFDAYTLYTYSIKVPKNKFEDDIYSSTPELLRVLPRACSILVHTSGRSSSETNGGAIVSVLQGPTKFSGRTNIDEDPEDGQAEDEQKATGIYNHDTVLSWAKDKQLEIIETEKANGKFAICQIIEHLGQTLILCGSKNYHLLTTIEQLEQPSTDNEITRSILADIRTNYKTLLSFRDWFRQGYSLVGELCDGQHFTDGDNTISWFGLFRDGIPLNDHMFVDLANEFALKTVSYKTVFTTDNDISDIDNVFLASRCKSTEGSVLRCRNISQPDQVILVKTKSVSYIVKRFTRQILLRGYKDIENLRTRFINAQQYHGLSTQAAIRVTRQLYDFCLWMMDKKYPGTVLGIQVVTSVRGQLPNGFNTYWKQFLEEGNKDISITLEDFGAFDEQIYLAETVLYTKRSYSNPAVVIFLQGLQGSGKSTIGDYCSKLLSSEKFGLRTEYIEQDMYWSDTNACQGALYHMIANASGPKIILVTRCNMNPQQYSRYLDICHRLPSIVTFFSPKTVNPLYFMISMAGIMNRSQQGDRLMVGRFDLPIKDVITFARTNYDGFIAQNTINQYSTFESDAELLELSEKAFRDTDTIIGFVRDHYDQLMEHRLSVQETAKPILDTIEQLLLGKYMNKPYIVAPTRPVYIGAAVDVFQQAHLESIVDTYVAKSSSNTTYLHHMTTHFYEKGALQPVDPLLPGQKIERMIDALVIRKSDNACAFRIVSQPGDKPNPHITARIPSNLKPMVSNSFVGLTDLNSVNIIPMSVPIRLTGFWFSQ
jgi:hypothetical protein